jgi:glycerol dehydrogenase-like iron-containing ADH family enzyme
MKRTFVFLLSCAALMAAPRAARPGAAPARTVYVMAMGSGLDQFLANHLAQSATIEIVTDPTLREVLFPSVDGAATTRTTMRERQARHRPFRDATRAVP